MRVRAPAARVASTAVPGGAPGGAFGRSAVTVPGEGPPLLSSIPSAGATEPRGLGRKLTLGGVGVAPRTLTRPNSSLLLQSQTQRRQSSWKTKNKVSSLWRESAMYGRTWSRIPYQTACSTFVTGGSFAERPKKVCTWTGRKSEARYGSKTSSGASSWVRTITFYNMLTRTDIFLCQRKGVGTYIHGFRNQQGRGVLLHFGMTATFCRCGHTE